MSSETRRDELARDVETLESRVAELESTTTRQSDRMDELDAGLQAVRGFLGGVDAVNEAVERRADAAIAAVERLEAEVETGDQSGAPLDVRDSVAEDAPAAEDAGQNEVEAGADSSNTLRDRLRTLR